MSSSDDDGFGGMFGNEEEEREQEKLIESRNKRVDIQVPRYIPSEDNEEEEKKKKYIESPSPLILKHQPGNHHSLWGHLLWNAGRHIVYMMDSKRIDVRGKSVLELGCGVAAPSFVAALNGARVVCATDYPDEALIEIVAENAAKVLVLDEETSKLRGQEPTTTTKGKSLDEIYTLEEIDKIILDDRIRTLVKEKSGLNFKPAPPVKEEEEEEKKEEESESTTPPPVKRLPRLNFFVEGLCWGNGDTIQKVCEKSNVNGFDIIFLSDLMFNHICHDQLLATVSRLLSRDPAARAYVVFSFHRVLKKEDDLNFFKKCSFYGLNWELVEENNDYPLMFPDDPGDPAIRKPVNVFELSLNFESIQSKKNSTKDSTSTTTSTARTFSAQASAPLDKFKYDVVVQGTGLVETLVSASCARAGLSVLHLDASNQYGSGFYSSNNKDRFMEFVSQNNNNSIPSQLTPCITELETQIENIKKNLQKEESTPTEEEKSKLEGKLVDLEFSLADAKKILSSRQLNFDTFTTPFLAQSSLILAIAQSQMAEHIEFQNVHRVVSIQKKNEDDKHPTVSRVPVSRKDVFNSGTSCISMLEARRLMRFIGDISNRSALERDTDVQRERHSNEVVESLQQAHTDVDLNATTIEQLLTTKYSFSKNLLDLVTLGGTLLNPATTSSANAVSVIFNYLMSIGRYSGSTPYLAPMYSASDLPQIFSRMSAVWGACFALERSAVGVVKVENTFLKGAGHSYSAGTATSSYPTPYDISLPANGTRILLDNGQHISAKCFVCPRMPSSTSEEFLRAIIVSKKALVTWKALEETCSDTPIDEDDKNVRLNCSEPLAVGYCRLTTNSSSNKNNKKSFAAALLQWSDLLEQSPSHVIVTHVTAKRSDVFDNDDDETGKEQQEEKFLNMIREQLFVSEEENVDETTQQRYASWKKHVVFATAFKWGEDETFLSTVGSLQNQEHFTSSIQKMIDEKNNLKNDDDDDEEENQVQVIQAHTLFGDLNDSLYAEEAERVFRLAMKSCGRNDDAKEMPLVKAKDDDEEK